VIRRSLPFDAWPEVDRIAWTEAIAEGDLFDGRGPAAHWAATTRYKVIAAYGRFLAFLAASEPSALAEDPAKRLTEDRFAGYLSHLAETAGTGGQFMFFAALRDAVRVMFPAKVPHYLSLLVARLEREYRPRSKAARIVTSNRLTALGIELMKGAIGPEDQVIDRVDYRDGLMIALMSRRPIRRRTFSLITIGTHLRRVGEEWRLILEGPETKSGRPFEASVPDRILPFLERYLREVRLMYTGAARHDGLWCSTKGRPLTDKAIYRIISDRTRVAFGQRVNPHLFRACAATTIAILDPARIGVARDLLEHASITTTNAYYNKARSIDASRLYAGVVAGLTPRSQQRLRGRPKQSRSARRGTDRLRRDGL
jgi:integrase